MEGSMRVLVVEDAVKLALSLKKGLEAEGYAVDVLHDGLAARRRLEARGDPADPGYDLVLLDIMLPGLDGYSLCREVRDLGLTVPILMLTARDAVTDRVTGLDAGADDYLVKPFAFEELLARMRTLLRRPPQALPPVLTAGDITLDPAAHTVKLAGEPVALSAKEFALLELFLRHPGEVLTRDRILEHVWDEEYDGFSNTVDVHVARLRRKLDRPGHASSFEARRGVGYVLRAPGRERAAPGGAAPPSGHDGRAS
jgi:two-component system, OmpR family, response regulator